MPKYDAICKACGQVYEVVTVKVMSEGEDVPTKCDCGGIMVKLFTPALINGKFGPTSKYRASEVKK